MLTNENLKTGLVAGLVATATLLLVSWVMVTLRRRALANAKQPCGCGGH